MVNQGRESPLASAIADLQRLRNGLANPPANAGDPVGSRRMDANMNRLNREAQPEGKQFSPSPVSATDWRSKSYDEMKKVKESFDGKQGQLDDISIAWRNFGEKWASEMEHYNTAVSNITESSWVGDTAESASAAVSGFVGGFPQSIRDYANEMSDRMAGLAANFRFAATNFPTIDGETSWGDHKFTGETWFGLNDYYQHDVTSDREMVRGSQRFHWHWGQFLDGYNTASSNTFDTVKAIVDKVFAATSKASYLLANNYSTPLQESVQNLRHLQSAGAAPPGAPGGPGPSGIPQSGGGGTGGGGGGGGQPVSAPDLEKSLDAMMKKTTAQNVDSPSSSDNPLSQVGNTAASMLSSLGSQASQAAQQAISQAQQTAEQLAQKTAGEVPNVAEPTGFPNGVTAVSSATPAGGGGGQGRGTGGGGGGSGAPSATNPPSERTTKTGTTKSTSTGARPSAGIAQTAQGTTGSGAGAPGAGGRGAGGGGDKVHKVLKALRTRVNGEEIAGPEISSVSAESAIEGDVNAAPGGDDGTRA